MKQLTLHNLLEKYSKNMVEKDYNGAIECATEIEKMFSGLLEENDRYKEINQGLLEVQLNSRNQEKEYKQWFEATAKNVQSMKHEIEQLKEDKKTLNSLLSADHQDKFQESKTSPINDELESIFRFRRG